MKCFYHPNKDAVGICKNCNKGLCGECIVDVGNGIACKGNCENEVKELNITLKKSKKAYGRASRAYRRNAVLYAMIGLVFFIPGLINIIIAKGEGLFLTIMGIIFLVAALWSYSNSKAIDKQ
jgi:hypothetical protein